MGLVFCGIFGVFHALIAFLLAYSNDEVLEDFPNRDEVPRLRLPDLYDLDGATVHQMKAYAQNVIAPAAVFFARLNAFNDDLAKNKPEPIGCIVVQIPTVLLCVRFFHDYAQGPVWASWVIGVGLCALGDILAVSIYNRRFKLLPFDLAYWQRRLQSECPDPDYPTTLEAAENNFWVHAHSSYLFQVRSKIANRRITRKAIRAFAIFVYLMLFLPIE